MWLTQRPLRETLLERGKWNLFSPVEYLHSSARFYIKGLHSSFPVTNFMEMEDVVFVSQDRMGLDYEKGASMVDATSQAGDVAGKKGDKYNFANVPCGRCC